MQPQHVANMSNGEVLLLLVHQAGEARDVF